MLSIMGRSTKGLGIITDLSNITQAVCGGTAELYSPRLVPDQQDILLLGRTNLFKKSAQLFKVKHILKCLARPENKSYMVNNQSSSFGLLEVPGITSQFSCNSAKLHTIIRTMRVVNLLLTPPLLHFCLARVNFYKVF